MLFIIHYIDPATPCHMFSILITMIKKKGSQIDYITKDTKVKKKILAKQLKYNFFL